MIPPEFLLFPSMGLALVVPVVCTAVVLILRLPLLSSSTTALPLPVTTAAAAGAVLLLPTTPVAPATTVVVVPPPKYPPFANAKAIGFDCGRADSPGAAGLGRGCGWGLASVEGVSACSSRIAVKIARKAMVVGRLGDISVVDGVSDVYKGCSVEIEVGLVDFREMCSTAR